MIGTIGAIWGIVGITFILGRGLFCIYPFSVELCGMQLNTIEWVALGISLVFMGYAEGYKGFHLKFSPRFAARAQYLKENPTLLRVLLAPLFCMGFFHATRKRKIVTYSLTTGIILLIIGVGRLDQPWRGIIDVGVLLGLGWGLLSVWYYSFRVLFGKGSAVSPETPDAP
jgi:hypothetical protein